MKSLHTLAICATIFLVGFSCSKAINNGNAPSVASKEPVVSPKAAVQKWEYKYLGRPFGPMEESYPAWNEAGKEGWEMDSYDVAGAMFKRPIQLRE